MIRKCIVTLLNLTMCTSLLMTGCSNSDSENNLKAQEYPLTAFSVKVKDSYYHGKIDQEARKITIGAIKNTYSISEVKYALASGATISPEPESFIHAWNKEQKITVTTKEQGATTYTIEFPKFEEEYREVLFYDDFDKGETPDPTKWKLETKWKVDGKEREHTPTYDQTFIEDGKLIVKVEKDKNGEGYRAGGVNTKGLFPITFGLVEVYARVPLPHPTGILPAIWMYPQKQIYPVWPAGGEIDIMEHIKQEDRIYQTIHTYYTYELKIKDNPKSGMTPKCDVTKWHLYGVKWTPDEIVFYIDREKIFSYPNLHLTDEAEKMQWPFTKDSEFYLILNMGLGGWAGEIDDMNLPAQMEIDWVKISELNQNDLNDKK